MELRWWEVHGSYAGALAAAETAEEAVEMARADKGAACREWFQAEPATQPVPPGAPTAPGLYAWWAE